MSGNIDDASISILDAAVSRDMARPRHANMTATPPNPHNTDAPAAKETSRFTGRVAAILGGIGVGQSNVRVTHVNEGAAPAPQGTCLRQASGPVIGSTSLSLVND